MDEQLFESTNGHIGDVFEKSVQLFSNDISVTGKEIWGQSLPLTLFLVEEERANHLIELLIMSHWKDLNLFLLEELKDFHLDPEILTNRLQQFFASPQGIARLTQYAKQNNRLKYENFLSVLLDKDIKIDGGSTGLSEILIFKIKDKWIIQGIYSDHQNFWRTLYAKKMYSCLKQCKLDQIQKPVLFVKIYKDLLEAAFTRNRIASILHKHVQELDYDNPKSFELKQLHLLNIVNHYLSGRRSLVKLKKCIDRFEQSWSRGNFEITEMEQTLLTYLLFMRATVLKLEDEQIQYARFLIQDERLNNHSVEIYFEFGVILNLVRPQPESIIKYYPNYYLENLYYLILNTFVKRGLYEEAFQLIQHVELATCSAIYRVINGDNSEEALAGIEATIQRDIMTVMKYPPDLMMEAIQLWRKEMEWPKSSSSKLANLSVRHISNVLKTLFVNEQYDGFEKLLEVYKKYLHIPSYTTNLHQFLVQHVENESTRLQEV